MKTHKTESGPSSGWRKCRRLLFAALAVVPGVPALASIAYVQSSYTDPSTSVSSVTVTYASAQAAGDLNVIAIGWLDSSSRVTSVTDSAGNTYSVAAGPLVLSSGNVTQVIYYAKSIAAAAAGTNVVTVTFSASVPSADVRIAEYSGIDTGSPLDVSTGATGTGTSLNSGLLTTTTTNDLLFAANEIFSATTAADSNYTQRLQSGEDTLIEDRVVSSTGSYSAGATQSRSVAWVMQLAAFKGAAGGGGDTQPPTAPTGLTATAVSSSQINLSWTASTDNVGVTGYKVERCQGASCTTFAQIATSTATTYSNTGLTASTSYSYRVRGTDAAGNLSGYSNVASATTNAAGDTTPPTAPSNLQTSGVGASVITLTWTASTDNVGVTGYKVERCQGASCTSFAQIGTPGSNSYTDSGLTAGTSYSYRVRATDAAGNLSGYSNTASATTATALSAPSGLGAPAVSSIEVDLSWVGSTGGAATISYLIESCSGSGCSSFTQIGTSSSTSYYVLTNVSANSAYSYRVRATDSAGDLSGYSNTFTLTTPLNIADCN